MNNFSTDQDSLLKDEAQKYKADDIFLDTDYSSSSNVIKPGGIAPKSPITNYRELVSEIDNSQADKIRPKYFFIGLIVLVLIFASIGFYIYSKFFIKKNDSGQIFIDNNSQIENLLSKDATSSLSFESNSSQIVINEDSDSDGLSDQEENIFKTDKDKIDTDDDGLSDKDEVKMYKTDPLNRDSDGDNYLDGEEVKNGYDPMGLGKLLNFDFLNSNSENESISFSVDMANWVSINSYIESLKNTSFSNPIYDFKYPNNLVVSIDDKKIILSGVDFKVYFEVRDNKLELDLSDWVMTQNEFSLSSNNSTNIASLEAMIATSAGTDFKKIIFIADKSSVYIFKYIGDVALLDNMNIFKSIASSFSIK